MKIFGHIPSNRFTPCLLLTYLVLLGEVKYVGQCDMTFSCDDDPTKAGI